MSNAPVFEPSGVILAGGRSSRLGPGSKAMTLLGGKPMIHHVIQRLQRQTGLLLISTQDEHSDIDTLGLDSVQDAMKSYRGPLTGLYSAMQRVFDQPDQDWLLLSPCDAPFIPGDLAEKLFLRASSDDKPVSVACYEEVPQPTFSLWHRSIFALVEEAVMTQGRGGLMYMLDQLPWCAVDWPITRIAPFFNVNTRADLQMAERLLDAEQASG